VVGGGDGEVLRHHKENEGGRSIDDTSHGKVELTEEGGGGNTLIESR
jgi:hypothetical protein